MSAPATREAMRAEIARLLHADPAEIGDGDDLSDLGLDSMRAMALLTRWNEAGPALDFAEFAERPTLEAWWTLVARRPFRTGRDA